MYIIRVRSCVRDRARRDTATIQSCFFSTTYQSLESHIQSNILSTCQILSARYKRRTRYSFCAPHLQWHPIINRTLRNCV